MVSPFPGMDPFLEGALWPDVHLGLSFLIKEQLAAVISDNYVVRTATYTVEDDSPGEDIGIMYPDVEVLRREQSLSPFGYGDEGGAVTMTPATATLELAFPLEVRIPVIEIRDRHNNQLITAIEILSPVNKRSPGLEPYRKKCTRLHEGGVHLLEIDLLRRGERPLRHVLLPKSPYMAVLLRAGTSKAQVWAIKLKDHLPVLPVPLKTPDPDLLLDLGNALKKLYKSSRYHLSINYLDEPPPPALKPEEQAWMRELLGARSM